MGILGAIAHDSGMQLVTFNSHLSAHSAAHSSTHSSTPSSPVVPAIGQRARLRAALQRIWGYSDFRDSQGDIIEGLLSDRDSLVVMPTGGGKSICFQLPALLQPGLTLVISPLIALMENQVAALRQRRQPAAVLHSQLPRHHKTRSLKEVSEGRIRLLYLSPETLLSPKVWGILTDPRLKINRLVVDEAHCLVQWGDTFRPVYQRLGAVREGLLRHKPSGSTLAIAAFTATADPSAQADIIAGLGLQNPLRHIQSPYRPNLSLAVQIAWTPRGRRQRLLRFMQRHQGEVGIVYVRSRRDAETLAHWLQERGQSTLAYHAGLAARDRRRVEQQWLSGETLTVVATSAFGMGIDKANVRWIAHVHPPALMSEYVQEIGRAGRDGQPAEALMLVSEPTGWLDPGDLQRQRFFEQQLRQQQRRAQQLSKTLPKTGAVREVEQNYEDGAIALALLHRQGRLTWPDPFHYRLQKPASPAHGSFRSLDTAAAAMRTYLYTPHCRWSDLLEYFGLPSALPQGCGHCDRCCRKGRKG